MTLLARFAAVFAVPFALPIALPLALALALAFASASAPAPVAARTEVPRLGNLGVPDARRDVLDGRLTLTLPEIATEPTSGPSRSDETRLVIDAGEERLEIRASELNATAAGDLAAAAARVVRGWGGDAASHAVASVDLASGLRAAEVIPAKPDVRPTGAFVRGLFVASADGSVQYLEARANAQAARDFAAADALARRVLHGVAPGPRAGAARGGAAIRLVTPSPDVTLFANLPDGIAADVQREKDRVVHRFHARAALGENTPSVTLTCAKDGAYHHDRLGRDIKPTFREAQLFGQKVLWHDWARGEKRHSEALVTIGTPRRPVTAHVLVLHRTDEQAAAMRSLVESMLLERRPE